MRTAIVVTLAFVVLFAASAMAQEEVIVDASVNVGESGEDTQSSNDNLPTLDLEAGMAEGQPQPQAGPSGPAGEDGEDGAPGARGHRGSRGDRGLIGPPGKDADPRVVAEMVLDQLARQQQGETPAEWAKDYIKALKAEKLVVGYPDGTIRPKEKADFERVCTVIGRVQQKLRQELAAETKARTAADKRVENLIGSVVILILCVIIATLCVGIKNKRSR